MKEHEDNESTDNETKQRLESNQTDDDGKNNKKEKAQKLDLRIEPLKVDMGKYRKYPTDGIF